MSQKAARKVTLLVDYENVQKLDLSKVQEEIEIKIFLGQTQSKIPVELVQTIQRFGANVEWIKVQGNGNNSLDFHIAFYLGSLVKEDCRTSFVILSKDKGFDPLIAHIQQQQIACRRVDSLCQLGQVKCESSANQKEALVIKVTEHLAKIAKNKRPKSQKTLHQYIKTLLPKQANEHQIEQLIKVLFETRKISESNSKITYNF